MKTEQTINLTPPIDGVQYGYNSDEIKEGDYFYSLINNQIFKCFYIYEEQLMTQSKELKAGNFHYREEAKKVILSTNPKDTRFPFLVMPSEEQEVERLALKAFHCQDKEQIEILDLTYGFDKWIAGFNAKKGTFTQEQIEKAFEAGIGWGQFCTGAEQKTIDRFELFKRFLQSLQPTAKAVRVEMDNHLPDTDGDFGKPQIRASSECPQGLIKAIEVIY